MADQAEHLREMVQKMCGNRRPAARTVTVVSGKGGVGKTSFTVNFAVALGRMGKRVVIVDADFGFSNVDILLGANTRYSMDDVVTGKRRLKEVVQECDCGVCYIAGGAGTDALVNLSPEGEERLMGQLSQLDEQADVILFDTGAGMRPSTLRLMDSSDESILVVTPEPTSIMDAFVVLKMAAALEDKPQVRLLLNMVGNETEAKETDRNFRRVVEKYLEYDLDVIGYVKNDDEVRKAVSALAPLMVRNPGCTAARQIEAIAQRYAGQQEFAFSAGGLRGLFQKLTARRRADGMEG